MSKFVMVQIRLSFYRMSELQQLKNEGLDLFYMHACKIDTMKFTIDVP